MSKGQNFFFSSEIWGHFAFTFCRYLKSEYEGIYLLQVLPAKFICWCHLILMKKIPFDYDWFCHRKTMAFMIIKGNTFCNYFPLYSKGNNSIFLRQSFFHLGFEGISYNSVCIMISKQNKFFDNYVTPHNHFAMVHHCKNSMWVVGQVKNLKVQVLGPL